MAPLPTSTLHNMTIGHHHCDRAIGIANTTLAASTVTSSSSSTPSGTPSYMIITYVVYAIVGLLTLSAVSIIGHSAYLYIAKRVRARKVAAAASRTPSRATSALAASALASAAMPASLPACVPASGATAAMPVSFPAERALAKSAAIRAPASGATVALARSTLATASLPLQANGFVSISLQDTPTGSFLGSRESLCSSTAATVGVPTDVEQSPLSFSSSSAADRLRRQQKLAEQARQP
ncbi:hypothetical protein SBRCBS47491_008518 [Sporothrix bragantina]|uniref:Uncharacterized protein n=1 Tax=Sporothrix bragantina TaxID=671064 RepID=A0ABP0CMQ4_9PEZI